MTPPRLTGTEAERLDHIATAADRAGDHVDTAYLLAVAVIRDGCPGCTAAEIAAGHLQAARSMIESALVALQMEAGR